MLFVGVIHKYKNFYYICYIGDIIKKDKYNLLQHELQNINYQNLYF